MGLALRLLHIENIISFIFPRNTVSPRYNTLVKRFWQQDWKQLSFICHCKVTSISKWKKIHFVFLRKIHRFFFSEIWGIFTYIPLLSNSYLTLLVRVSRASA